MKKAYDRTPHELFVELDELRQTFYGGLEWKETARWIKYEENVEELSNRWGKPHISCLNFESLFSLRKGLERGSILLDLEENELHKIMTKIAESMVSSNQIPASQKAAVLKVLLLKHKHIKEAHGLRRASRVLGLNSEDHSNAQTPSGTPGPRRRRSSIRKSLANIFKGHNLLDTPNHTDGVYTERRNTLAQLEIDDHEGREATLNLDLIKKIPDDSEAFACHVGSLDFLAQPIMAFVRLAEGVLMENVIEVPLPVRFIFVLLGPYETGVDYREIGRSICTLMSDKFFHEAAYRANSRNQILAAINEFLNTSIVFPPSEWKNNELVQIDEIRNRAKEMVRKSEELKAQKETIEEKEIYVKGATEPEPEKRDPLQRKGILFYGVIEDIRIRYPKYLSDITDGLSPQVLSTIIFIFFAALSPAITFGGLYGEKTDKYIGVGETLLVTSISGVIFALFACQPLLIIGATGPLMIFDLSLLKFCNTMELDYLAIRVWIGGWVFLIGILFSAFEAAVIVKKFTRFTEELYATLVCIIFIYGAFESLVAIFISHPLVSTACKNITVTNSTNMEDLEEVDIMLNDTSSNETSTVIDPNDEILFNQPNTALLSTCLMLGTFILAWKLKKFRNSKFLGRGVRRALGDFGVPIAIFLMVLVDFFINDVYTDKLGMPKGLKPSNSAIRGWIINPFGVVKPLPVWCMFAAGPAACLLFILIFLEGNICLLILDKPERGMKKGNGFHLDMIFSCMINTISGLFGAPFMSPACVRTITHLAALTIMSSNMAPGESPKIVGCLEQRISALFVALLIGLSVMLYALLNLVPTSVLLGIFLYMGISAIGGIQFFDRLYLYLMPVKYHPNMPYVKNVRTLKMHMFTGIQVLMLVILWIVKQSPASLAVPFILLCLIPIRLYILPFIFTKKELIALDGAQPNLADEDEPDFYEEVHNLGTQIEQDDHHTKM